MQHSAACPLIASRPAHQVKPIGSGISAQIQQHRTANNQVSTAHGPPDPKDGPTQVLEPAKRNLGSLSVIMIRDLRFRKGQVCGACP
jgi:hypothetical protein